MQTDQGKKMPFSQQSSACSAYYMVSWTQVTTTSLRRDRPVFTPPTDITRPIPCTYLSISCYAVAMEQIVNK